MTEARDWSTLDTVEKAWLYLEDLEKTIKRRPYDCECQVGGVDAMSMDTDYMRVAVQTIKAAMTTLVQSDE